jgi:CTP synthase (UTP-ammonia lyase)
VIVALGDRDPAFLTHREVDAALGLMPAGAVDGWTATDSPRARDLAGAAGVWLLPGTPYRDEQAADAAVLHCLRTGTPFLGTCGGFQYACLTLARSLAGVQDASHAESGLAAGSVVVAPLSCSLYGEVREVRPVAGTQLAAICGVAPFPGYHYCGFGLAADFAPALQRAGVVVCATADDAGTEAIELPDHPFFLATAFQPQVGCGASGQLPPLLAAFLAAARQVATGR